MKIATPQLLRHKFGLERSFVGDFQINRAILSSTPYEPEVLIVGTSNPATPYADFEDFFYGRDYFWPAFKMLQNPKYNFQDGRRIRSIGEPEQPLNPTLPEILTLCKEFKLTFADLVDLIYYRISEEIDYLPNGNVILKGREYNLKNDNEKGGILGLANLDDENRIRWNTELITNYLINTPSIKHIYLTRVPRGLWKTQWDLIVNHPDLQDRNFSNILTPSGRGNLPNISQPFNTTLKKILHYWVWNNLNHPTHPVNSNNIGHLDHNWLLNHGIDINQF
jgi:hypothetical protein